jgi:hypothetical protein
MYFLGVILSLIDIFGKGTGFRVTDEFLNPPSFCLLQLLICLVPNKLSFTFLGGKHHMFSSLAPVSLLVICFRLCHYLSGNDEKVGFDIFLEEANAIPNVSITALALFLAQSP